MRACKLHHPPSCVPVSAAVMLAAVKMQAWCKYQWWLHLNISEFSEYCENDVDRCKKKSPDTCLRMYPEVWMGSRTDHGVLGGQDRSWQRLWAECCIEYSWRWRWMASSLRWWIIETVLTSKHRSCAAAECPVLWCRGVMSWKKVPSMREILNDEKCHGERRRGRTGPITPCSF